MNVIKKFRAKHGLGQYDLGLLLDVSEQTIRNWEKGMLPRRQSGALDRLKALLREKVTSEELRARIDKIVVERQDVLSVSNG